MALPPAPDCAWGSDVGEVLDCALVEVSLDVLPAEGAGALVVGPDVGFSLVREGSVVADGSPMGVSDALAVVVDECFVSSFDEPVGLLGL